MCVTIHVWMGANGGGGVAQCVTARQRVQAVLWCRQLAERGDSGCRFASQAHKFSKVPCLVIHIVDIPGH